MPTFFASKGLELRSKLEERDQKGARKRRWQVKTLLEWFGLGGKRLTRAKLLTIQQALERSGIESSPGIISQAGLKDRVNLIVNVESPRPSHYEGKKKTNPKTVVRKPKPKLQSAPPLFPCCPNPNPQNLLSLRKTPSFWVEFWPVPATGPFPAYPHAAFPWTTC
jgi:hypothetical protein